MSSKNRKNTVALVRVQVKIGKPTSGCLLQANENKDFSAAVKSTNSHSLEEVHADNRIKEPRIDVVYAFGAFCLPVVGKGSVLLALGTLLSSEQLRKLSRRTPHD